jgi:hypothetical protein
VLLCNAWARCCAPLASILFQQRLSVVNVFMNTQIKSNAFRWLKMVTFYSFYGITFLYLQCFPVQFPTGIEMLFYVRDNASSELVCQNRLHPMFGWMSDIAWDFLSDGVCR